MRRFYDKAELHEGAEGFGVALDGKLLRTPAKAPVVLDSRALALLVVDEWQNAPQEISVPDLHINRLVFTVIDMGTDKAEALQDAFAAYAGSDMLCYREGDRGALIERQAAGWDPLLDWARQRFDVSFTLTAGIMPVDQPEDTIARLCEAADGDIFRLCGLAHCAGLLGSAVLALALETAHINCHQAWKVANLDAFFQIEAWGEDTEAMARLERQATEIAAMEKYFQALKGAAPAVKASSA